MLATQVNRSAICRAVLPLLSFNPTIGTAIAGTNASKPIEIGVSSVSF
jgi:hypothetical protein